MTNQVKETFNNNHTLTRSVGLTHLIFYGTGNILGAGIYGLLGKVVGTMGNGAWLAFITSMIAAGLTGLSYASVGSRYPRAGGAAYVSLRAFKNNFLSYVVGFMVMMSGFLSMATATRIFSGYLSPLIPGIDPSFIIITFALVMTALVYKGIKESLWFNVACTSVELGGLLFIIFLGLPYVGDVDLMDFRSPVNLSGDLTLGLVLSGAVLTFFSFIGFEDLLNISEEVKDPKKNLPRGLLIALLFASTVYILISLVAVSVVPAGQLASSSQPMTEIVGKIATWMPANVFNFIALFAVSNTVLLNLITTSRLMFGMARQGQLPSFLNSVHGKRSSPDRAVLLSGAVFLILAVSGDISSLAKATSIMLLCSFVIVNASLLVLRKRDKIEGSFEVPAWVPLSGLLCCGLMAASAERNAWMIALGVFVLIGIVYVIIRPKLDPNTDAEV